MKLFRNGFIFGIFSMESIEATLQDPNKLGVFQIKTFRFAWNELTVHKNRPINFRFDQPTPLKKTRRRAYYDSLFWSII